MIVYITGSIIKTGTSDLFIVTQIIPIDLSAKGIIQLERKIDSFITHPADQTALKLRTGSPYIPFPGFVIIFRQFVTFRPFIPLGFPGLRIYSCVFFHLKCINIPAFLHNCNSTFYGFVGTEFDNFIFIVRPHQTQIPVKPIYSQNFGINRKFYSLIFQFSDILRHCCQTGGSGNRHQKDHILSTVVIIIKL